MFLGHVLKRYHMACGLGTEGCIQTLIFGLLLYESVFNTDFLLSNQYIWYNIDTDVIHTGQVNSRIKTSTVPFVNRAADVSE